MLLAIGLCNLKREDYFFEYPTLFYDDRERNSNVKKRITWKN